MDRQIDVVIDFKLYVQYAIKFIIVSLIIYKYFTVHCIYRIRFIILFFYDHTYIFPFIHSFQINYIFTDTAFYIKIKIRNVISGNSSSNLIKIIYFRFRVSTHTKNPNYFACPSDTSTNFVPNSKYVRTKCDIKSISELIS